MIWLSQSPTTGSQLTTPANISKGTITKPKNGTASKFTKMPITDTLPKNHTTMGSIQTNSQICSFSNALNW